MKDRNKKFKKRDREENLRITVIHLVFQLVRKAHQKLNKKADRFPQIPKKLEG